MRSTLLSNGLNFNNRSPESSLPQQTVTCTAMLLDTSRSNENVKKKEEKKRKKLKKETNWSFLRLADEVQVKRRAET